MDELREIIKQLQQSIPVLVKQYTVLQKKNVSLEKENEKLKQFVAEKEQALKELKQKLDGATASTLFTTEDEKQNLKKTLDNYISEIDKCLSMLNAK